MNVKGNNEKKQAKVYESENNVVSIVTIHGGQEEADPMLMRSGSCDFPASAPMPG